MPLSGAAEALGVKKSPRRPLLFVGHGSPMNALATTPIEELEALGAEFGARYPKPQLILASPRTG